MALTPYNGLLKVFSKILKPLNFHFIPLKDVFWNFIQRYRIVLTEFAL